MRALSLFSGIGGLDLAMEAAGLEIVGQVEKNPFCQRVLRHHWPHILLKGDIHDVSGTEFGAFDLLAGGFPCQPNSNAGKKAGRDDSRNLWPEFARVLRTTHSRWFVGENVPGLLSTNVDRRGRDHGLFGDILRDLAEMGYTVGWLVLSAAEVGAPHLRERVCIIAHLANARYNESSGWNETSAGRSRSSCGSELAHPDDHRLSRNKENTSTGGQIQRGIEHAGISAVGVGLADADRARSQIRDRRAGSRGTFTEPDRYAGDSREIEPGLGDHFTRFSSRLAGHPGWPARPGQNQFPYEPPRTHTDTKKDRVARLEALGNAVVPQQFVPVFQAIVASDREVAT